MTHTLATRKQSEAIRRKMQEIRTDLPEDVDDVRQRVKQLSDWRYHMSQHSAVVLAAAFVAGYLIVPGKSRQTPSAETNENSKSDESTQTTPTQNSIISGIAGAAGTMLLRQATSFAADQIAQRFNLR